MESDSVPVQSLPDHPSVSVILPVRNSADGLRTTLPAILNQEYAGSIEILVADGSTDEDTRRLIRRCYPTVRLVPNPEHIVSTGFNRAMTVSTGEVVVRCDAYSVFPPGYIQRAIDTLRRTGAAVVGGQQCPVGISFIEQAAAIAQSIPLGVGISRHRIGGAEGPTDTVYLGIFRRQALEAAGKFDTTLLRNQDYMLNWSLRNRGESVWFDPELKAGYRPRGSLRALARQYFDFGRWKCLAVMKTPQSVCIRHTAAPALVLGLAASALGVWAGVPGLAAILPLTYLVALLSEAIRVGAGRHEPAAVLLPVVLAIMHLSWGIGFFYSICLDRKQDRLRRQQQSSKKSPRDFFHETPSLERPVGQSRLVEQETSLASGAKRVAATPRISVGILTWNSVGKIEPCLESLFQGTHVPGEIIVVDNDSKDQTRAVLAMRFPSVRVIENTINLGVARARNQGLVAARGTYVLVLDDDTIMQPEALARLVAVLDASPTVALCGPQLLNTAHEPISTPLTFPTLAHKARRWGRAERRNGGPWDNSLSGRMREVDYVIGACQLIRRAALDEVGLYDEHIFYGPEDIDFCLRLRQAGWRIILQPAARVIHAEQRIARSIFSPIGRKHTAGLGHYFWKHRYGLSQSRLYKRLPTFSPVSHSL